MDSLGAFMLFFSVILCFSLIEGQNHVEQVCQQTQNQANCMATFATNADSKNASLPQLGIIALKMAAKSATNTSEYIEKSLKGKNVAPEFQQNLSDCLQQYIDANDLIDNSVASLLSKADTDIQTWLNAVLSGVKSCDDGIPVNSADGSLLKRRNGEFRELCNTALVVGKLLVQQKNNN